MKLKKTCFYLFSAFLTIPVLLLAGYLIPRKWGDPTETSCRFKICVARLGFHSNIIVPVENGKYANLNDVAIANNPNYRYLAFGWGERDWYTNPPTRLGDRLSMGFRALFFPNPSVLRVQKYYSFPQADEVECVGVSQADYLKLMEFIQNSFQLSAEGEKILVADNPDWRTQFYKAKGSYSIIRNSNSWTAEALRMGNVNTPLWAGLSFAIMHHLEGNC